jgi:hypothetical protein
MSAFRAFSGSQIEWAPLAGVHFAPLAERPGNLTTHPKSAPKFTPEPGLDRFVTASGRLVTKLLSSKGIAAIKEAYSSHHGLDRSQVNSRSVIGSV